MVVRPRVTYAATMCWPRVKFETSRANLNKLQRLACLGITGAMRAAPTSANEVLLGFSPLQSRLRLRPEQELVVWWPLSY
jgi:hypothetical protein